MKIKVFHVVPNLGVGGAEKLVLELCKNIDKSKFDITLISLFKMEDNIYDKEAKENNIKVIYLDKKIGFDFSIVMKLKKIFKKNKECIINTHLYVLPYIILATLFMNKIRIFHTVHNIAEKELGKKLRKFMNISYHFFNVVPIAISDTIRESIQREYKINGNKIPCIYNGIDTKKFVVYKKTSEHNNIKFINVARFTEQKNHNMLIKAFGEAVAENPNIKLILIGDGPNKREIEKLVKEKKIENSVIFKGIKKDICKELNEGDIYISASKWEGLPISILEAMSCGLPIISTNVGGTKDIVKDNGLLVDSNNINQLKEAILKLSLNNNQVREMGEKSINYSKLYDIRITSSYYEKLYKSCR